MEKFSLFDCSIAWRKDSNIPKSHQEAIKKELKAMLDLKEEALKLTLDSALRKRSAQIIYWLANSIGDYRVAIWYESSEESWHIVISNEEVQGPSAAQICSDKYSIASFVLEKEENKFQFENI